MRLADFLPYKLSVLSNRVSNAIARSYSARFGLTIPQWRVLAVLAEKDGQTATQVCEATEMDKVTVSRAVAVLLDRGLVARAASAHDGRARILSLAPAGRGIYAEIAPIARGYEERLLAELDDDEAAALARLIDRLSRVAGAL